MYYSAFNAIKSLRNIYSDNVFWYSLYKQLLDDIPYTLSKKCDILNNLNFQNLFMRLCIVFKENGKINSLYILKITKVNSTHIEKKTIRTIKNLFFNNSQDRLRGKEKKFPTPHVINYRHITEVPKHHKPHIRRPHFYYFVHCHQNRPFSFLSPSPSFAFSLSLLLAGTRARPFLPLLVELDERRWRPRIKKSAASPESHRGVRGLRER